MALPYFRGDERPAWEATVDVNGVADDMSTGYTFEVKVFKIIAAPVLTKTTGITGAAAGIVTVAWVSGDLDLVPGNYTAQLKTTRTADSAEWTITEDLLIKARS